MRLLRVGELGVPLRAAEPLYQGADRGKSGGK
jgi:hypothetical protein